MKRCEAIRLFVVLIMVKTCELNSFALLNRKESCRKFSETSTAVLTKLEGNY